MKCSEVLQRSDVLLVPFYPFLYGCIFCILLFNSVSYVFLSLRLCILIDKYALFCIFFANWPSPATLNEVFPCLFLSCKVNDRVYLAKTGHGLHSSWLVNCVVLCIVCVSCFVLSDRAVTLDQFINLFLMLVICHGKPAFHCEVDQQYWHDLVHIHEI